VDGNDDLAAAGVTPLLVAAFLADEDETVLPQCPHNILCAAHRVTVVHVKATSSTLAPAGIDAGEGSNQRSNASFALLTASSSVSPADAHPGSSGKNADHRWV